jgi:cytidylate kinase
MKKQVPQALLEKAAKRYEAEIASRMKRASGEKAARVITISRMYGAGGISISTILSEKLGWPVWDREIMNVLADQSQGQYQARLFEALDETTQGVVESFLSSVGGQMDRQTYNYLLPRAVYIIAQSDAIILGRGAHLLLPDAFGVFLKASMESRVKNVMQLLDVDEKAALREIEKREKERTAFLDEIARRFGKRTAGYEPLDYDLEINTDKLDFEAAADVIKTAVSMRFALS